MEFKNTTIKDIKIWWACAKTQAEQLIVDNKTEKNEEKKKTNERHIELLKGMCVAFAMVLENEKVL